MSVNHQLPNDSESVLDSESTGTNPDPRHQKRIRLMQALFSHSYQQPLELDQQTKIYFQQIIDRLDEIDPQIKDQAPERPLSEINRVDLAILRLSLYEALHTKTPVKVVINEAVELAKEFGTDSSPRFVNGVLGKILIEETNDQDATQV